MESGRLTCEVTDFGPRGGEFVLKGNPKYEHIELAPGEEELLAVFWDECDVACKNCGLAGMDEITLRRHNDGIFSGREETLDELGNQVWTRLRWSEQGA